MASNRRFLASWAAALAMTVRVGVASAQAPAPAAPPAAAPAPAPVESLPAPPGPGDPLAGFAGERAFLRSPGNELVLFPSLLLQVMGAFFPPQDNLKSGFSIRRARLELAGWMGPMFYFDLAGDFAPPPAAGPASVTGGPPTDAYVAFAPADDLFIVQAGQFDAPFSFENRTLDAYTPFIERSLAVRALGAPKNKDLGLMVHGTDAARTVYYSGGVFNGDGPGLPNADNKVDVIGRAFVAPLARGSMAGLREVSLGASVWYGQHVGGLPFAPETTPGGFVFFNPTWTTGRGDMLEALALHEGGSTLTLGGELNIPVNHVFGARVEGIFKKQDLAEDSVAADGSTVSTLGRAKLQGLGGYAEVWAWAVGDDRQLPRPGLELPLRLGRVVEPPPQHGLMIAARGELLKEDLTSTQAILGDPNLATTRITAASLAVNYWYGRRVRASLDYVLTFVGGTTENVKAIGATTGKSEQELLLLLAMGL
jgi:hypothetical protein